MAIDLCNIIGHQPIRLGTRPTVPFPGEIELKCPNCKKCYSPLIKDKFDTCDCGGKVKQRTERYKYCGTCGVTGFR
jgi:NADH pyrophosphatase NudC (nudix superfamily)